MSVPVIRWTEAPGPYAVAFSMRLGGVSEAPFDSLNLGRLTDDDPARVDENRSRLCTAMSVEAASMSYNRQVHGAQVRAAPTRGEEADALWTDTMRAPLLVFVADCLPVAVVRTNGTVPAVAAAHVGWRGLLAGIVERATAALGSRGLAAIVGPGIGRCCYEVGEDVAESFTARFGAKVVCGRFVDLRAATTRALEGAGARVEHVDLCTSCNSHLFFSHRRDGGRTGRQGMLAYVA